ncbi:MAG TPA: ATP-binding protein [Tepidisphaeraceae bacterium]|jgi:signal transduction histidine kinase|nr:ATP-binding protein [Tepidisphaeraceae bacterium]
MSIGKPEPPKHAVLYVDDEEQALKYFRKGLDRDFRILTAPGAAQAIALLEAEADIAVVISDQRMPGRSGVSLLTEVKARWPAVVRILVTAYTDIDSAVAAVNAGSVYKYLTKPADFNLLRLTLTESMNLYRETIHNNVMAQTLRKLEEQCQATAEAQTQREQLQQRLIAASREAGRAEVATGILHNVGNVLNSMNVSAAVVTNTLHESRIGNLCKGLAMLEEHAGDLASFIASDERGQRLPGYLAKLAPVISQEHATIAGAMESLSRNIEHIVHVVQHQQSDAREVCLRQAVNTTELAEDAIRINQTIVEQNGVEIVRDFADIPILMLDRHRVLQILVNLVSNAARALKGCDSAQKRITVKIRRNSDSVQPQVCFEVSDNGAGIAPENLTRIFTYGFTTRREGHGFGLHSAANAAREMGGSLTASSGGAGLGATFTLGLPAARDSDAAALSRQAIQEVSA